MTATAATTATTSTELDLVDLSPAIDRFRRDVIGALSRAPQRELPTQYLYDDRGSALFDRICELPEYYPTRTELAIMDRDAAAMAEAIGPGALIIEYGSGSSVKTRRLLEELRDAAGCVLVDISRDHLLRSAESLASCFPEVEILPVCADFTAPFDVPEPRVAARRRVVYFPGSTIGNFLPSQATRLLSQMAAQVGPGGGLLIGTDLRKDPAVLEAAYNDAQGVTAEFNLNLLRRINRELGANFELDGWRHQAIYDQELGRIEMLLVSGRAQVVEVGGQRFAFAAGESIRTEYSHKYAIDEFHRMARQAGFSAVKVWTDPKPLFAVHLLERA
ncbi:L-histidine N(alpha)-methyltransferase [Paraliomyxa miuraensis]|uniref:L-histidine N(alpha)-methyltransferase n=1 Tax=Paraliomyxa miuraensis TaxID=376150 RepID=UPI00225219CA|nr:L-histidine N(alpha)-methyltransferase [Paraliomyxa miuraensis]MCX4247279.1 L-histidine N(alpha)-methyltransferase [Paraliomyxa miuraensis]